MHTLLAYTADLPRFPVDSPLTAVPDVDFTVRNGNYIFVEDYGIAYVTAQQFGITDARLQSPTFDAINVDGMRLTGFQQQTGQAGFPTTYDRFMPNAMRMPKYEEIQFQASAFTNGTAYGTIILIPTNWSKSIPPGRVVVIEGKTAPFPCAQDVWCNEQPITLTDTIRGGVYAVIRAACQVDIVGASTVSPVFRLIFPRSPSYRGRRLRPGWFTAGGPGTFEDVITQDDPYHLGTWGYFHSFELPQLQVLTNTSNVMATATVRLWCVYLGGDEALLSKHISAMSVG